LGSALTAFFNSMIADCSSPFERYVCARIDVTVRIIEAARALHGLGRPMAITPPDQGCRKNNAAELDRHESIICLSPSTALTRFRDRVSEPTKAPVAAVSRGRFMTETS